jgi:hypothetical protein
MMSLTIASYRTLSHIYFTFHLTDSEKHKVGRALRHFNKSDPHSGRGSASPNSVAHHLKASALTDNSVAATLLLLHMCLRDSSMSLSMKNVMSGLRSRVSDIHIRRTAFRSPHRGVN